jgi:hypothetical protein
MRTELLRDGHAWTRIADPGWTNPLDPSYAATTGGRWNPPDSYSTLYLNADRVAARVNLRLFTAGWPYEPEDLRNDTGPILVYARLPRRQKVMDAHTPAGLAAVGLPNTYPNSSKGLVPRSKCQAIGQRAHDANLRGVHARGARAPDGVTRELAWFPATARSRARKIREETFEDWYFG